MLDNKSLYRPQFEHDSCGIGFVANLKNKKSNRIVTDALTMLENMEHRGGCGCEPETGDGAGIMVQLPHKFFAAEAIKMGFKLPKRGTYGAAMCFLPADLTMQEECISLIKKFIDQLNFELIGTFREVPVNREGIGKTALAYEPKVVQFFVKRKEPCDEKTLERKLFVLRKYLNHSIHDQVKGSYGHFYIASLSYKTIVYKGQLRTDQVGSYYKDLRHPDFISALALVHSRFSTNTFPRWSLAQPFRYIAHNGEINTIKGNVNWMRANEELMKAVGYTQREIDLLLPICDEERSDSSNLDNAVEMLHLGGRSLPHVMMMLIPEAWEQHESMDADKKAYYEFQSALMQPWDGPASISFTDGNIIGATLDRNGLRPSRYCITDNDRIVMSSEAGALPVDPKRIIKKGRLEPGKMFVADLIQGRIISDDEIKADIVGKNPYKKWVDDNRIRLQDLPYSNEDPEWMNEKELLQQQIAFGYSKEDIDVIFESFLKKGKYPLGSMGNDTPLAVLSNQSQHLANYFKQQFAQVSNPPIDSYRESMVMSLNTTVGSYLNILNESEEHCRQILIDRPVLGNKDLKKLVEIDRDWFKCDTVYAHFNPNGEPGELERALDALCEEVLQKINKGVNILIISDRDTDAENAPIPSLLAAGTVHQFMINNRIRARAGIIMECGDAREAHHFATLIGYGANAVNPYLAFNIFKVLTEIDIRYEDLDYSKGANRYTDGIDEELLKIFSKMGISTLASYHGAQIFEAIGLSEEVINKAFSGTVSRIGGIDLDGIAKEVLVRHDYAFPKGLNQKQKLVEGGLYQWKQRGEFHMFNPETIHLLQHSTKKGDYNLYKKYAQAVNDQSEKACTLRSLFDFDTSTSKSISLDEVEPKEAIFKRFATGAMSFGSISHEAHSTLAIAMNRIGGKSNSGEGGEDEARNIVKENGDWERSAIKQVASGRFGVTINYLVNAIELQIKMAQGAKPGEGGQLPGYKVDDWIGRTRHSTPGVGLISPPPHHDIYSIEDLAQLIFDLKNANPEARINVKLVSKAGVGTIAAGVAKAFADVILIAGHDGGTGASPLSSVMHAGLPWELGLAEAHQTLVMNDLRSRITLQADGQMKTGRDLAIATLLGAEEWGVATAALIVEGCIMMRKCHLNTCPVGVATQDPDLRALFTGKAEDVINLFNFMAEELREIMATLGYKTIDEMVGQVQHLKKRDGITNWKAQTLDLSPILFKQVARPGVDIIKTKEQQHPISDVIDRKLISLSQPAILHGEKVKGEFNIVNTDRSCGTMLSGEIAKKYGSEGLPDGTINFKFNGSAGQSFGAFAAKGLKLEVEGEANDYFGKGNSGSEMILYPPKVSKFVASDNIICGNVAFYGATSGEAFINGIAGERFCVRNSGVKAVVEGVGDHGCEYMTGGLVVILGKTGRNFAAGMSGGIAYVYDVDNTFKALCNTELIEFDPIETEDLENLEYLIGKHYRNTKSEVAKSFIDHWETEIKKIVKVMPVDYKAALAKRKEAVI